MIMKKIDKTNELKSITGLRKRNIIIMTWFMNKNIGEKKLYKNIKKIKDS